MATPVKSGISGQNEARQALLSRKKIWSFFWRYAYTVIFKDNVNPFGSDHVPDYID